MQCEQLLFLLWEDWSKYQLDKIQLMGKLHDTGKLITQSVHSQDKSRKGFVKAGVAKETKTMFEDKNRRVSIWIKSIKQITEAKVMDKVVNSIKNQSFSKSKGLEDATSGQLLNSNSMLERKPFPNLSLLVSAEACRRVSSALWSS